MRTLEAKTDTAYSSQMVWEVLADFGGVAQWAPGIRRAELKGDQSSGIGARRVMRHVWGFGIEEVITQWTDGSDYAFHLVWAPYPMRNVRETWSVEDINGRTSITTTVSYNMRLGALGKLFDKAVLRFLVAREMRAGLRGLKQYLERQPVNEASLSHSSEK